MKITPLAILALLLAAPTWADTVTLKDGTTHEGTVVKQNSLEIQLRIDNGGMRATVTFPMDDVANVSLTPAKPVIPDIAPSPQTAPAPQKPTPHAELKRRGFLIELANTILGHGPDDPARLPPDLRTLWQTAMHRELLGNPAETLDSLRALDDAFAPLKGGLARLDGVSRHERNGEPFANWFARVHWEVIGGRNYIGGPVDLSDVRDSERRPFIGILKERTNILLDQLKPYFPPIDPTTGKPQPFAPTQLGGINLTNAVEVKREATFANSYLLAQMKIEPNMPTIDRLFLASQLQTVQRILAKANDIEPAAKAAAEKADRDKRIADEKARHSPP